MPRAKTIVMTPLDPERLREHAARASLDLFEPYRIYSPKQRGEKKGEGYAIVHEDRAGKRTLVMGAIEDRSTAKDFMELLQLAWLQGRRSAMLE